MPQPMRTLIEQLATAGERRVAAAKAAETDWTAATEFAVAVDVLRADHLESDTGAVHEAALAGIAGVFGLDATDAALLWLVAAGDLDATVGLAYGHLRGTSGSSRPSVALALELVGVPTATSAGFARLGPDGPLRRHRLLELTESEPWLGRLLRVPDSVVAVLAGGTPDDPAVRRTRATPVPLDVPGTEVIARAVEGGAPLVWVRAGAGTAGLSMAAGAFDRLGLHCLALDLRRHVPEPGSSAGLTDVVAAGAREAGLRGWGLVVAGCELAADADGRGVFEVLEQAAVPVVAVGSKPWQPSWSARFPLIVEAGPLATDERELAWRSNLGELVGQDPELRATLLGLRLSPEDIAEAARLAGVLAGARGIDLDAASVREAARRVGGSGGGIADRVFGAPAAAAPRFNDLVLPPHVTDSLHQLVSWAQHRDAVVTTGMLRGRGRGIAALFTGNPGTGKTLAAHVIAEELSIELFQVDLSSIVDKYIGETEKNLERVFQAAEALDVVLFFDEADALFGSRSDVHDARDRYANQEVAYLLQRMEHFDGITILSTNLRGNLDRAFSRRMSFIVHFPDPDAPTRRRLWEHHLDQLPALDPADPVNLDFLAGSVELAGGDIRNIVLAAAYDAAGADEPVGMRHVVEATVREYRKLGRVVPEHGFIPIARG